MMVKKKFQNSFSLSRIQSIEKHESKVSYQYVAKILESEKNYENFFSPSCSEDTITTPMLSSDFDLDAYLVQKMKMK